MPSTVSQRGAGVFGIKIELAGEQRLMAQESSPKVEPPLRPQSRVRLDLLRQQLAKDDLLGKIFGADANRVGAGAAAGQNERPSGGQAAIASRRLIRSAALIARSLPGAA